MKALIIAAGDGTRIQKYAQGKPKCLLSLLGLTIIERIILAAKEAGIRSFVIVIGYQGNQIKALLKDGKKYGVSLTYLENKNWRKGNGVSVLKAKEFFKKTFVLLMADHLFAPDTLKRLQQVPLKTHESVLAVDKKIKTMENPQEATKVFVKAGRVISLGKKISPYNGFDTGMFICSPFLFKALIKATRKNKYSLSDAMRILVKENKLKAFDIGENFWADCDTYEDFKFAEKKLLQSLTKPQDGVISQKLNRKISAFITKLLVKTPISPNFVSLVTLILSLSVCWFLFKGTYPWLLFGGLAIQFLSILDGCDGEIARLKFQQSRWGAFFDTVLDRYVEIILIFGMVYGYWKLKQEPLALILGFFAVAASLLDIFSSREIKVATRKKIKWPLLNIRRDLRLLILALGAISRQIILTMLILIFIANFKIIFRLFFARKNSFKR